MKKLIKKITILTTIVIFSTSSMMAQETEFGVKAGLNLSNLYIDKVDDENVRVGYHGGLYLQMMDVDDVLGVQAELLLSTKGSTAKYNTLLGDLEYKFNLGYLDIPVLFVFEPGELIEFHGGAYMGYLFTASANHDGILTDGYEDIGIDNFKKFDYGLCAGVALDLGVVRVGGRYNYGLQQLAKSSEARFIMGDAKNSYIQFFVGLGL